MDSMIKYYFQITIDSIGEVYLDAEQQLIALGEIAASFLRHQLNSADTFSQLITQVILEWIADNQAFKSCLDYFDQVEHRAAQTPMGQPPPESVAIYLVQNFDDTISSLLGVYLVKLSDVWPAWKTLGVILYLGELNSTASADSLIRFISYTTNDHYRKFAVQSLVGVGDASVLNKLEAELEPLETARCALQQAIEQITEKLKAQT